MNYTKIQSYKTINVKKINMKLSKEVVCHLIN